MLDGSNCENFRILAQVVTWILVFGGWCIIDKQNNHREKRKETRAILHKLFDDLDTIEKKSYAYHRAEKVSIEDGRDLKLALSRVYQVIDRQNLLPCGQRRSIAKLRQAITLRNFDTTDFLTQSVESELLAGISTAKDDLVDSLERQFYNQYR